MNERWKGSLGSQAERRVEEIKKRWIASASVLPPSLGFQKVSFD